MERLFYGYSEYMVGFPWSSSESEIQVIKLPVFGCQWRLIIIHVGAVTGLNASSLSSAASMKPLDCDLIVHSIRCEQTKPRLRHRKVLAVCYSYHGCHCHYHKNIACFNEAIPIIMTPLISPNYKRKVGKFVI